MTAKILRVVLTALILLVAGCSFERNVKLDARLPMSPAFKQMPLNMGVYYSRDFVEYVKKIELIGCGPHGRKDKTGIFFIFPVGASSRDLFDQIIASMFTTVTNTPVTSQPLNNISPIKGLLEPRIESFDWNCTCSKDYFSTVQYEARVSFVINLYNCPDRRLLASMHFDGLGTEKPKYCSKDCRDSIAVEKAIQNAMAKFMIEFYERPEIKQWLSTSGVSPGNYK